MSQPRVVLNAGWPGAGAISFDELAAEGVIHADVSIEAKDLAAVASCQPPETIGLSRAWVLRSGADPVASVQQGLRADCLGGIWFDQFADFDLVAEAAALARQAGLRRCASVADDIGRNLTPGLLELIAPDRIAGGEALVADCLLVDGRVVGLGQLAAAVRDRSLPVAVTDPTMIRLLGDAGLRLTFDGAETDSGQTGLDPGEIFSARERTAGAAFVDPDRADELASRVRQASDHQPARLVHMAESARWQGAKDQGAYLPAEFEADGFIHLSALAQVLTPANRFYRGRTDLVALVIDAHSLAPAVIWEPGTGTTEYFPHLYGALDPAFVVAEIPMVVEADGTFLLPERLARAVRGHRP